MKVLQTWDEYTVIQLTREDEKFYCILGWFFGSRQIAKELGMPIYDDDNRIWVVTLFFTDLVACSSIEMKDTKAVIKSAWVKPEHRGKGIYSRMLKERIKIAENNGVKTITATATENSKKELTKHGFSNVGMKGKYYLMRKEIKK